MIQKVSHMVVYVLSQDRAYDFYVNKLGFEELKARGVQFVSEPKERPYGIETILKDDSGNWFSLTQHR